MNERLALAGPRDELKDLADTIDDLLARREAHVAEQQQFAANASHELRTPPAVTQSLLDVARSDPNRADGELVEHLHEVNTRAIELTEALLLLSRTDQRSFAREPVDLSLLVEEATETLLPLAEKRGVENTGEELAPELVSRLSEPFLRGTERVHSDHAGVGLGLAIVKSIADAHDGTLTLARRPGGGLHVELQLPAAPPREPS